MMNYKGMWSDAWRKCTKPVKMVAPGMPYLDGRTSGKWPTHAKGTVIYALPYSSVFMWDGDILYNRSLATYYSATLNPYSVLYKRQTSPPHSEPDSKRASYYGVVCSTFAGYLYDPIIYRSCKELRRVSDKIDYRGLLDIEPGMLLISNKHVIAISDLSFDDVPEMTTIEARPPEICKQIIRGEAEIRAYIQAQFEDNYALYRGNTDPHDLLRLDDYATDVIFEYGNNTWYKRGETIKAYIPSGAKRLYYRLQGAEKWGHLDITSKLVNLTSVIKYNRTYEFTTNRSNKVYALVTQVQPSAAVLRGDTVTLKTHSSNCRPLYWRVFKRTGEKSEYKPRDRNNNVITRDLNHFGMIHDSTFRITKSKDTTDYIVWIMWDTGYGQCHTEIYPEDT